MEVTGFPEPVKDQILKLASINLCPNLSGQICCALMMNPPQVRGGARGLTLNHEEAVAPAGGEGEGRGRGGGGAGKGLGTAGRGVVIGALAGGEWLCVAWPGLA